VRPSPDDCAWRIRPPSDRCLDLTLPARPCFAAAILDVAGAAVEKTGEATDSADWKSSGEHRKEEGVHVGPLILAGLGAALAS
jgi:hypothetical protein